MGFLGAFNVCIRNLKQNLRCKFPVGGFAPRAELAEILGDCTCADPLFSSSIVIIRWEAGAVTYQLPREEVGLSQYFSHSLLHSFMLGGFVMLVSRSLCCRPDAWLGRVRLEEVVGKGLLVWLLGFFWFFCC